MIEGAAGRPGEGPVWALGLMSGTSMDGVDAALLLTDGQTVEAFGAAGGLAYCDGELPRLAAVAADWTRYRPPETAALAAELAANWRRPRARCCASMPKPSRGCSPARRTGRCRR